MQEIIPYIDETYRTIPEKGGRGLMGFSMGGYITINIGMNHPDMFNSIYAVSPGLLLDDELGDAMKQWDGTFKQAYGSAFSPAVGTETNYSKPLMDGSPEDQVIVEQWLSGFGHMQQRIETYLAKSDKLAGIGLEVGENDGYRWIYTGTTAFSEMLTDQGIENQLDISDGGHIITKTIVIDQALPFLVKYLFDARE